MAHLQIREEIMTNHILHTKEIKSDEQVDIPNDAIGISISYLYKDLKDQHWYSISYLTPLQKRNKGLDDRGWHNCRIVG